MRVIRTVALIGLIGLTAACNRDEILEGERVDIRAPWGGGEVEENRSQPISLPSQAANGSWSQRQGTSGARPRHPALSANPQLAWSTPIGAGDSRRARLTTDPVAAGGRVFTLDAGTRVQATSEAGQVIWSSDVLPPRGARGSASGGALAVSGSRLYVASAFAFVAALDVETGNELWRVDFDSPLTGAPAVNGESIYVSATDSTLWALDASTGRIQWSLPGTAALATVARGAAPAITNSLVVFPTQSGELTAARRGNGALTWTSVAAGRRIGSALASISAITGDPVVDGSRIYAATQAGRTFALDAATGSTIWTAEEGAVAPVWPVGGSVFLISDQNRLMRLDARDGSTIWAQDLPLYTDDRARRRLAIFPQHGPVLAGGRLWVASGDGALRGFDPVSGAQVFATEIPGGAASGPIVAGGTLYVLGRNGALHAYR
ncbi:PQQ-binding-like beta-propeller repeat protein [Pararhodobacter oceanensis]|uniref:outer membrane protein assembly factor BamB family protein n=1 Tax=Pararhodobacter oceanensis TaxID=2172121 RepID=UPI003A95B062